MENTETLSLAVLLASLTSVPFPTIVLENSFSLQKTQQFSFSLTNVYSHISSGAQQSKFNSCSLEGSRDQNRKRFSPLYSNLILFSLCLKSPLVGLDCCTIGIRKWNTFEFPSMTITLPDLALAWFLWPFPTSHFRAHVLGNYFTG